MIHFKNYVNYILCILPRRLTTPPAICRSSGQYVARAVDGFRKASANLRVSCRCCVTGLACRHLAARARGAQIKNTSVDTVAETIDIFKKMGFDPQRDIIGNDPKLPPVFLTDLPDDLRAVSDPDIRKAVFISIVLPHVPIANERIRADRQRLQRLHRSIEKNELCGPVIVDGLSKWQITAPGRWIRGNCWEEWISYRHASRSPRRFRKPGGELRGLHRPEMRCSASTPLEGRGYPGIGQCERRT